MSEKIKGYPGERIRTRDLRAGKVPVFKWSPKVRYAWTAGPAMSRFIKELKNGKIIGRKCNKCDRVLVPPRMFCELCFRPTDRWVYVKDTGTINTYSISHLAADASRLKEPILVAVIDLDGASEGMGILHKLGEVKQEDVRFGMKVKAVWKTPEDRTGAITDIKYFKPVEAK
ncbi:DNA-binding protein [Candidatus Bathyarchaeota archaeon]|nr:Zn-ribbon domain-containing OB-fold protein [Candidatus Bathyarchaeota archaeon]NIR14654.1 Zn-ribbon domain-containing OB-fold protein [Desulfobacterales bacterium]NIU81770.1 DNA-binding protein [Candidatus Bathyarchaeota archaeon]NIV67839.1 DNA-binding protein [Candidatus Bathyarchaeota archaeon]NIW16629.1 DNA-binding protein [Candidatus Bathyarchaeota archaeon]